MEEKEILMLFIKEAEERNIFKSKSNTMQEQVIDLINEFVEKNKLLRKYGIQVMAFICGDELKRFPMYEGLPSLEMHRDLSPLASCIDLMENLEVDDVFIGDSQATKETIVALENYVEHKTFFLRAIDFEVTPVYWTLNLI